MWRNCKKNSLHPHLTPKAQADFRHAEMNNIRKRAFVSADVPAQLEPTRLDRNDGKIPDGATKDLG